MDFSIDLLLIGLDLLSIDQVFVVVVVDSYGHDHGHLYLMTFVL
jgi:hypothetical protein